VFHIHIWQNKILSAHIFAQFVKKHWGSFFGPPTVSRSRGYQKPEIASWDDSTSIFSDVNWQQYYCRRNNKTRTTVVHIRRVFTIKISKITARWIFPPQQLYDNFNSSKPTREKTMSKWSNNVRILTLCTQPTTNQRCLSSVLKPFYTQ